MPIQSLRPYTPRSRITWVWSALVALTVAAWILGHDVGLRDASFASVAVIVLAFVKVRLVALDFMELRHAPEGVRWAVEVWCVVVCAALCGLFWWRP